MLFISAQSKVTTKSYKCSSLASTKDISHQHIEAIVTMNSFPKPKMQTSKKLVLRMTMSMTAANTASLSSTAT